MVSRGVEKEIRGLSEAPGTRKRPARSAAGQRERQAGHRERCGTGRAGQHVLRCCTKEKAKRRSWLSPGETWGDTEQLALSADLSSPPAPNNSHPKPSQDRAGEPPAPRPPAAAAPGPVRLHARVTPFPAEAVRNCKSSSTTSGASRCRVSLTAQLTGVISPLSYQKQREVFLTLSVAP